MNSNEYDNIIKLTAFDRYKYFIKKVADFEELWTITYIDGSYALSDIDDNVTISFWPKPEYIDSNLSNGWEKCVSKKLTLDDLEDELFDFIASQNYLINVFPKNGKSGFVVSLDEFARDLSDELKNY
ncbi:DUF2750 domain-containing protein [Flavobacterium sp. RHBU_3]|uniref:DUF2750 domain-containing protein n=1 Tax=Flavobacterium sp. RHBU_3 TaxID=3391184 RepID=UPI003984C97E